MSLCIILFGLSILTFGLTYLLPSDPVEELITSMGGSHDPEVVAKLEEQYGTSRPFWEQYADWIQGVVLHGDFGISVKYNKPVKEVIAQKLPNTVKLACTSFLTMILIAFPLGILSAVYKDRVADYIIRFMSFIGVSMPSFWFGMLLIWIFAVRLGWLPVAGSSSWKHIVMPTLTLAMGMKLFLYQEDSGGNGRAAGRGIYYRMSIKGDRQNADYFSACSSEFSACRYHHAWHVIWRPAGRYDDRRNGI